MKTKKIILLLFSIILLPLFLNAQQTYFSKIYNPFNTFGAGVHVVELDSMYLIGGIAKDSLTNYQTLIILKIFKTGNLISVLKPGKDSIKYFPGVQGSLSKNIDGSYIWGGQAYNGIKGFGFLIKLDNSLNKEWEREFMFNNDTVYSYLGVLQSKQTYDKGFILVGDVDASGQYNTDILLIKTDSLGNKLWQKTYNYLGFDRGWNVIQTPDIGFLIGAGGYKAGVPNSYNGLVIKTDSFGNEQWRRPFGGVYDDDKCVVANHPDGSFIVATSYSIIDSFPNDLDDDGVKKINIIKLSSSNQVIWNKQYGPIEYGRSVGNLVIDKQNNIIVAGQSDNYHYNWDSTYSENGVLLKVNTNGDSLWYREFVKLSTWCAENSFYDLKQTSDGGFIMCGQADAPFTQYQSQHIWVLKVDSFGCDTPGCHTVGINELVIRNQELVIYPNPASYELNVEFIQSSMQRNCILNVYNSMGVRVKSVEIPKVNKNYKFNIMDLQNGIYFVHIVSENQVIFYSKFIKL